MKKLLTLALSLLLMTVMMLNVVAAEDPTTSEDILASDRWVALHRWDFDGNLTDSIGGATVTKVNKGYFQEPTYENGKIKLTGTTAYTLDTALEFPATDDMKYLRIDVKGFMDFSSAQAARRIFGLNTGSKMAGLNFVNIAGAQYGGCSFGLSTDSPAWNSFVLIPDQSKFDKTAENLYTFIYYNSHLYYYANGVLIADAANTQGGAFTFTDFLGCSYTDGATNNYVGTIDYIEISMFGPEKAAETNPPAADTNDNTSSGGNANTGVTLIAVPAALLAATGIVIGSRKRR